jgi:hypothetical protein
LAAAGAGVTWLRTVSQELVGLFVDDGRFALAILAWLIAAGVALPRLGLPPVWPPLLLFGGLVAILLESAVRRSR